MDSYSFTYKDVLKRYERIINKPSKFEIRLLATILLIITIVNITSLCFASESEDVTGTVVSNLYISPNANFFQSASNHQIRYIEVEKGYKYTITNTNSTYALGICFSNDVPEANKPIYLFSYLPVGESYSFVADDYEYFYFDYLDFNVPVTREKIEGQSGAVHDLVNNVGISQVWDIFDTGIGFVGVVVLFAFGIFLIVIAVKKVSKGKSEF